MSLAANQRRPYDRRDRPVYGEQGHGPKCYGLPYPKQPLSPPVDFKNGTDSSPTSRGQPAMSSRSRNTRRSSPAIKLGIFVLVSVIVTGTLTAIMGSFAFGTETEYKAEFTSASLLEKGDDVRVAGVTVGSVKEVEIKDRDAAEITFKIKEDVPAHHGVARLDPVPQPGRRPLHGPGAGRSQVPSGSPTEPPSRSRAPSPR